MRGGAVRWDPEAYRRFLGERERPAEDLLCRVPLEAPRRIVDLGCGDAGLTYALAMRWPEAAVLGVDASPSMLESAEVETTMRVELLRADIADWAPAAGEAPDLIVANSSLHWLDDHAQLFPRLLGYLARGGCLAVQMPRSWALPSHAHMRETLATGGVGGRPLGTPALRALLSRCPVADAAAYHRLLAPLCARLEIWETLYYQMLSGENPVLEWMMGAGLRPVLDEATGLHADERRRFLDGYTERLRRAYPACADGRVPFPFPRLFIVACVEAT
ncbi:methyltransferase domain-containing protein [bacterium]|nr:methyltransferase domain-containing protein [bacterium]